MKVLQINATYGTLSTGKNISQLGAFLLKNGCSVYNVFANGTPEKNDYIIGSSAGHKLHWAQSVILGTQGLHSRFSTLRLIKYIEQIKPDIVHLNNLHDNYINIKILGEYLAENNIATVLTLHDCWFFTGKCCHFSATGCNKWLYECEKCPRVHMDNKSLIFDRSRQMFKLKKKIFSSIPRLGIVGVSDWITNQARRSFLGGANYIERIYNWVDTDVFSLSGGNNIKKEIGLENKKLLLGVSTYWNDTKGHDGFVSLRQRLDEEYAVVLIGNKPSGKAENGIIYVGNISSEKKLAEFYSAADVLVIMSLEESFGKVAAEAFACGTPVAAYDSTALGELIQDNVGALAEQGNIDAMTDNVIKIVSRGKEQYSDACIKYSKDMFDIDKCCRDYLEFYKKLLSD